MDILTALDDADLFALHFKGDTWGAWRAFLAVLFALPMGCGHLRPLSAAHGPRAAPAQAFAEAALVCGRRGGKSRALALIAVFVAAMQDGTPYLASGEVATIAIIAVDRKQARSIFWFAMGLLTETPMLADLVQDSSADSITLRNRVTDRDCDRQLPGFAWLLVPCRAGRRNCILGTDESSANPDQEMLSAPRSGLVTRS